MSFFLSHLVFSSHMKFIRILMSITFYTNGGMRIAWALTCSFTLTLMLITFYACVNSYEFTMVMVLLKIKGDVLCPHSFEVRSYIISMSRWWDVLCKNSGIKGFSTWMPSTRNPETSCPVIASLLFISKWRFHRQSERQNYIYIYIVLIFFFLSLSMNILQHEDIIK